MLSKARRNLSILGSELAASASVLVPVPAPVPAPISALVPVFAALELGEAGLLE